MSLASALAEVLGIELTPDDFYRVALLALSAPQVKALREQLVSSDEAQRDGALALGLLISCAAPRPPSPQVYHGVLLAFLRRGLSVRQQGEVRRCWAQLGGPLCQGGRGSVGQIARRFCSGAELGGTGDEACSPSRKFRLCAEWAVLARGQPQVLPVDGVAGGVPLAFFRAMRAFKSQGAFGRGAAAGGAGGAGGTCERWFAGATSENPVAQAAAAARARGDSSWLVIGRGVTKAAVDRIAEGRCVTQRLRLWQGAVKMERYDVRLYVCVGSLCSVPYYVGVLTADGVRSASVERSVLLVMSADVAVPQDCFSVRGDDCLHSQKYVQSYKGFLQARGLTVQLFLGAAELGTVPDLVREVLYPTPALALAPASSSAALAFVSFVLSTKGKDSHFSGSVKLLRWHYVRALKDLVKSTEQLQGTVADSAVSKPLTETVYLCAKGSGKVKCVVSPSLVDRVRGAGERWAQAMHAPRGGVPPPAPRYRDLWLDTAADAVLFSVVVGRGLGGDAGDAGAAALGAAGELDRAAKRRRLEVDEYWARHCGGGGGGGDTRDHG